VKVLVAFFVLILVASILVTPVGVIWSLNLLFPALAIPVNFSTYVAMCFLLLMIKGVVSAKVTIDKK
jgi:hypothetical protein